MKLRITLCALASLLLALTADAVLPGTWPAVDKAPPPVAEWTALVDQSKVPKAPVVKTVGTCPAKDDFCNWSCTLCTRNDTDITQCPNKGDWGLTFDDGPTEFTNTLLDFLASKNTLVTFFVIGSRVFDNPEILQKAVKAGHQIGVHTWSHPALTTLTNEQIIAEIKWTEAAIKQAVGITPKYMRPPFGDYDDRVRSIAAQLGYKIVIWDLDTNDWQSAEDKNFQLTWIEGNFTQWVKMPSNTGHISLEHDLYKQTAERAQLVVPIVQNAGFTIKQVAVCMGDSQPYVENVSLPTSGGAAAGGGAPAPAPAPAAAPAAAGGAPAAGGSYPKSYLESPNSASSSSAMPATSSMPSTNDATSSNINLSLFIFLIMGTLVFV